MNLESVKLRGFQSFGPDVEEITFDDMTFLLGPNGSGKTGVLHALARMFAVDASLRGIRKSDFHVAADGTVEGDLFVEARFSFPEAGTDGRPPAIPEFLNQMQLESVGGPLMVLIRLSATIDDADEIEEQLQFVRSFDADGKPRQTSRVDNFARRQIQLHYLPARRNPREHISYSPTSLLGNALRAVDWTAEAGVIDEWSAKITDDLSANAGISALTQELETAWSGLHRGAMLAKPSIRFGSSEIDHLLRQLTVNFAPDQAGNAVGYDMLSDGQQSLLYVSTVVALHEIGQKVLAGASSTFNESKLQPAIYTLFAVEEPENSLSPYYLGRIFRLLRTHVAAEGCQAVVATHSPSVVKRVDPDHVRFLRLDADRRTSVNLIRLPDDDVEAAKYIKQAVQAYPELYFARLVILGEGASEEVVIPRLLSATGTEADEHAVAVVPLGGRHVNHMWRLLNHLRIPHVTLLDLDSGRFGGGWGRVRTTLRYLQEHIGQPDLPQTIADGDASRIPTWDQPGPEPNDFWLSGFEAANVFFSAPLDLDLLMLEHYPDAFPGEEAAIVGDTESTGSEDDAEAAEKVHSQVLGKKHTPPDHDYQPGQLGLFSRYHSLFQLGSKPAAHLETLANLSDSAIVDDIPPVLERMIARVTTLVKDAPE